MSSTFNWCACIKLVATWLCIQIKQTESVYKYGQTQRNLRHRLQRVLLVNFIRFFHDIIYCIDEEKSKFFFQSDFIFGEKRERIPLAQLKNVDLHLNNSNVIIRFWADFISLNFNTKSTRNQPKKVDNCVFCPINRTEFYQQLFSVLINMAKSNVIRRLILFFNQMILVNRSTHAHIHSI